MCKLRKKEIVSYKNNLNLFLKGENDLTKSEKYKMSLYFGENTKSKIIPKRQFRISYSTGEVFLVDNKMKPERHIKKRKTLRGGGIRVTRDYNVDIYAKNYYMREYALDKPKFVNKILEKCGKNINDLVTFDFQRVRTILSENDISNYLEVYLKEKKDTTVRKNIKENYEKILKRIVDTENIDISKILTDLVFDNSRLYLKLFVNVFATGVERMLRAENICINSEVLRYLLDAAILHSGDRNFGIIYSTIDYIVEKTFISRNAVTATLRKLEYCGIIDYIVGDGYARDEVIDEYLKKLKLNEDDELEDHYNRFYNFKKMDSYSGALLFPVINFKMLLNYTPDFFTSEVFQSLQRSLGEKIKNIFTDKLMECIEKNMSYEYILGILNDKILNFFTKKKIEKHKNKIKLKPIVVNLYNRHVIESKKYNANPDMFGVPDVVNAKEFFEERKNKYHDYAKEYVTLKPSDYVDSAYFVNKWIRDLFWLFYVNSSGKTIERNSINCKKMENYVKGKEAEFSEFVGSYLSEDSKLFELYYNNDIGTKEDILKQHLIYKQHGMIEDFKRNARLMDTNTFTVSKNKEFKKLLMENAGYRNTKIYINQKLGSKINKLDVLDKNKIQKYTFSMFELVKQLFAVSKNKTEYIFDVYKYFVNVNKSPIVVMNNIDKFLIKQTAILAA